MTMLSPSCIRKIYLLLLFYLATGWMQAQPDTLLNFLQPFIGEWHTLTPMEAQQNASNTANDIGFKFAWAHDNQKILRFYEGIPDGDMHQRILESLVTANPNTGTVEFLGYQMRHDFLFKGRFEPLQNEAGFVRLYDVYYPPGTTFRHKADERKGMKSYRDICRLIGSDTLECMTEQLDFGIYKPWGRGQPYRMVRRLSARPMPSWVVEDWENRTQGSGIWVTDNTAYQSETEPYEAYGIAWSYGLGKKHLKGRLYCIKDGEDVGTVWQFTEFWDPKTGKIQVVQLGSDGTVGRGTIWPAEKDRMKEKQTFISPNGNSFEAGHEVWIENGDQHTQSFTIVNGKWEKRRFYVWKKQAKSSAVEVPAEYKGLAFLIGEWRSSFGDSKAKMTFKWGENKRNIQFKNQYQADKDQPWVQENEGLISYQAVKDKLVFITSYSKKSTHLMAEGEYQVMDNGAILRQFTCHYKAGDKLPWSDGATAPSGGKSIDFKQIWTPIDPNTFQGEFYWKKDGKWENPFGKEAAVETWKRLPTSRTTFN